MKKSHLLISAFLILCFSAADAQYRMHVELNDGITADYWTYDVKSISWDYQNPDDIITGTSDATDITGSSATVQAWANIQDELSDDLKVGIIYCTEGTPSENNGIQKTVSISSVGSDGQYTVSLIGLAPSTTYLYRSFVCRSGVWFYGNVCSFTTKSPGVELVTGFVGKISFCEADVSGAVCIDKSLSGRLQNYGICYSTSKSSPTVDDGNARASKPGEDGSFVCQLAPLSGSTTYYYRSYAYVDGSPCYGQARSFTTLADDILETGEYDEETQTVTSHFHLDNINYSTLTYGVCYATISTPTVGNMTATTYISTGNEYTVKLEYLPKYGTTYYRAFVTIDGVAHYGDIREIFSEEEYNCPVGECVDLGLSVKWATFNIGASNPEECGDYFAWGETVPKSGYSWSNYIFSTGANGGLTKYCSMAYAGNNGFTDSKTVLDIEDDAAHVNWGGDWRMPTNEEFNELLDSDNCTWTWTARNGVNGYEVVSKKPGYEGNSIFLPVSGCCERYDFYGVDDTGYYWSTQLRLDFPTDASCMVFNDLGRKRMEFNLRNVGQCIRPVLP